MFINSPHISETLETDDIIFMPETPETKYVVSFENVPTNTIWQTIPELLLYLVAYKVIRSLR